jgi:hypothetical protein
VIWTRLENNGGSSIGMLVRSWLEESRALPSIFAEGIPVRAKDFSQSREDGPRILPSM